MKILMFTDIHYGRKSNSIIHNTDCDLFIDFVISTAKKERVDSIAFLGDWYENRTAIHVETLTYSYKGAKKLNDLGIPVFFIVGNHDMNNRENRDIYSTITHREFQNFKIIDQITEIDDCLFVPYLNHQEYPTLLQYSQPFWFGHFEFKGFYLTGMNHKLETGPSPSDFTKPTRIFSGHFHKRQISKNVVYIGNCFPMDYSDVNDGDRGLAIFDTKTDDLVFINWKNAPKYIRANVSDITNNTASLPANSYVELIDDVGLSYEDTINLRKQLISDNNLRTLEVDDSGKYDDISAKDTETLELLENVPTNLNSYELITHLIEEHCKTGKGIETDILVKLFDKHSKRIEMC